MAGPITTEVEKWQKIFETMGRKKNESKTPNQIPPKREREKNRKRERERGGTREKTRGNCQIKKNEDGAVSEHNNLRLDSLPLGFLFFRLSICLSACVVEIFTLGTCAKCGPHVSARALLFSSFSFTPPRSLSLFRSLSLSLSTV